MGRFFRPWELYQKIDDKNITKYYDICLNYLFNDVEFPPIFVVGGGNFIKESKHKKYLANIRENELIPIIVLYQNPSVLIISNNIYNKPIGKHDYHGLDMLVVDFKDDNFKTLDKIISQLIHNI